MKNIITLCLLALVGMVKLASAQSQQLDLTFDTDGIAVTEVSAASDYAGGVAIQADQKIVAVGQASISGNNQFAVVRYNTDGSLDNTFGTGGVVTTLVGTFCGASAVAIQPDSMIVVSGYTYTSAADFVAVRYKTNGTLDSTFGTNGIATASVGAGNDFPRAMLIQPDGKIVLAGRSVLTGTVTAFALARFETNGTLDANFGTGGVLTTIFGTNANDYSDAFAIELQSTGKIVATGDYTPTGGPVDGIPLARYKTDGTLDSTFGTNGITVTHVNTYFDIGKDLIVLPNDQIVVASEGEPSNDYDAILLRFTADGVPDVNFGTGGIIVNNLFGSDDRPTNLLLQSDGKIYMAGYAFANGTAVTIDGFIARFIPDGSLDNTFGTGGSLYTVVGTNSTIGCLALQANGKLVAAGNNNPGSTSDFFVARYDADGAGPTVPAAPSNLAAAVFKAQSTYVALTWVDNSNNEDEFVIERSTDGNNYNPIDSVAADIAEYLDYDLLASTTYYYRVYAYNTTGSSAASNVEQVTTDATVGIGEKDILSVQVFPNPASGILFVNLSDNQNATVEITSITGNKVFESVLTSKNYLDVSGISKGLYFLKVYNAQYSTIMKVMLQ